MIMITINVYLLNLEIDLILEMFAITGQEVVECVVQLTWGFPPRSKLTFRKVFQPGAVPQLLFRPGGHWICGTAGLGFSSWEQVDVQDGFSPSSCSTTPIQVKSFDVENNVATCLEQGVADHQMHVYEWLQQLRSSCIKGRHYHRKEITSH